MPTESLIKPTAEEAIKSSGFGAKVTATGIKFGKPSQSTQSTSSNSVNWEPLVSSVASGGVASLLGGAGGSLGLGSIVSGLLNLFGGASKTPPPLTLFQLPASRDVTVNTGSSGSAVYQGSMDQTSTRQPQEPIYSNTSSGSANAARSATASGSLKDTAVHANAPSTTSGNAHLPNSTSTQPTPASVAATDVNGQWFMDRSSDIAAAVRNAMLNSSSLNDVVADI
jgi:hypothetical protein